MLTHLFWGFEAKLTEVLLVRLQPLLKAHSTHYLSQWNVYMKPISDRKAVGRPQAVTHRLGLSQRNKTEKV